MRWLSTSLPMRKMSTSVRVSVAKLRLTTEKAAQGPFATPLFLRVTGVGLSVPNSNTPLPFARMMSTGGGPPVSETLNEQVERLPVTSRAVQLTVVTPSGKVEPLGGAQLTVTPGRLSVTVGGG